MDTGPGSADIAVAGMRGSYQREALIDTIGQVRQATGVTVQVFDPAAVYGQRHLEAAVTKAVRSHAEDRAIARDLAAEIACYAAGTHQIARALDAVGIPETGDALIAAAVGDDPAQAIDALARRAGLERDDGVIGRPPRAMDRIGVPEAMRKTVPEEDWELLVLEHVALLDAER